MKHKKAAPQGPYVDRLRTKYPFRICHSGYEAVLCGIQPLNSGQDLPLYRFPGGVKVVDPAEINNIVEW